MLSIPRTPIVVTDAADEEFWEFDYRTQAPFTNEVETAYPYYVPGARKECEARRAELQRFGQEQRMRVRTGPCIGPHYFKRTGPPSTPGPYEVGAQYPRGV